MTEMMINGSHSLPAWMSTKKYLAGGRDNAWQGVAYYVCKVDPFLPVMESEP